MATTTLNKDTLAVSSKKTKTVKSSVSKDPRDFLKDVSPRRDDALAPSDSQKQKQKMESVKKSAKKKPTEEVKNDTKQETQETKEKEVVSNEEKGAKTTPLASDTSVGKRNKDEKNKAVESIQNLSIDSKETEKTKEKSSLFSSFFSKKSKVDENENKDEIKKVARKEIVTISEPVKATPIPQRKIDNEKKLSTFGLSKQRDQFIENLSMLVLSGMSIIGAISSIIKQTKTPGMKLILERILLEIESGSPVWKAFDKTGFFKGYTISLIRLGEESGNFAENLKVVALEEEKDREFKSKVRSALMYPIFVLGLTGIIGIGISWFILPKLAKIFFDLKLALPLITKVLLGFGLFLNEHGLVAVPLGIVAIGGIGYVIFGWQRTKFLGEAIIFSIPGIKTLLVEVEVARFGYLLGTLLEAGLPVTKAIDSLASASEVIRYKKFYLALRESIDAGNSFEKSFNAYKNINSLIPPPVQQLIISGEQSGNLNKTLIKVGQVLEAKSDTTTKNLTIIMEPILLVIVWAGVVSVAFAVILPIYSLVGGLNTI